MVFNDKKDIDYNDVFSEEIFLDSNINKNINVFLATGIRLTGELIGHGANSILIEYEKKKQLVYKSAIATISTGIWHKRRMI